MLLGRKTANILFRMGVSVAEVPVCLRDVSHPCRRLLLGVDRGDWD